MMKYEIYRVMDYGVDGVTMLKRVETLSAETAVQALAVCYLDHLAPGNRLVAIPASEMTWTTPVAPVTAHVGDFEAAVAALRADIDLLLRTVEGM